MGLVCLLWELMFKLAFRNWQVYENVFGFKKEMGLGCLRVRGLEKLPGQAWE